MTAAKSRRTDSWLSWKKQVQESWPNVSKALGGSCTLRMEWAEVHYSSNNSQHPNLDLVFTIQGVLASTQFQRAPSKIREFKLLPCKLTAPKGRSHFYCVCNNSTLATLSPKRIQRRTFKSMNFRDNSRGVCVGGDTKWPFQASSWDLPLCLSGPYRYFTKTSSHSSQGLQSILGIWFSSALTVTRWYCHHSSGPSNLLGAL